MATSKVLKKVVRGNEKSTKKCFRVFSPDLWVFFARIMGFFARIFFGDF